MEIKFNNVKYVVKDKKYIDELNLNLKVGKINTILGPTGSGKSLLVKMLYGIVRPTEGNIKIGDIILDKNTEINNIRKVRSTIGFVFQFPDECFFSQTVKKELMYTLESLNYAPEKIEKRINDALKMVGLSNEYLDRDPLTLSSGEMRQLAIANALTLNPKILILDEPTIGLDINDKKNLIRVLKIIKRRYSKTIIIFTKDVEFIHQFTDHIFVINKGKLVMEGDKYTIFKQDKLLDQNGIPVPKIIEFELIALNNKKIKLGYRDEINDLIKDILRNI